MIYCLMGKIYCKIIYYCCINYCFFLRSFRRLFSGCRLLKIGRNLSCCWLITTIIVIRRICTCRLLSSWCCCWWVYLLDCSCPGFRISGRANFGWLRVCCLSTSWSARIIYVMKLSGCCLLGWMLWSWNDNADCRCSPHSWAYCSFYLPAAAASHQECYFPPSSSHHYTNIYWNLPWIPPIFAFAHIWSYLYPINFWFCLWFWSNRWLLAIVFFLLRNPLFTISLSIATICLFHLGRCAFCSLAIYALRDVVFRWGVRLGIRGLILLWCRRGDVGSIRVYFSKKGLQWIYCHLGVKCSCWILIKEVIRDYWSLVMVF